MYLLQDGQVRIVIDLVRTTSMEKIALRNATAAITLPVIQLLVKIYNNLLTVLLEGPLIIRRKYSTVYIYDTLLLDECICVSSYKQLALQ